MKFHEALHAHVKWTLQFKDAIEREGALDTATISAADRCELGVWLHGEARAKYGGLSAYSDCIAKHDHLHRVAGELAERINAGDYDQAATMLHDGSPYTEAAIEMGMAISKLRDEAART